MASKRVRSKSELRDPTEREDRGEGSRMNTERMMERMVNMVQEMKQDLAEEMKQNNTDLAEKMKQNHTEMKQSNIDLTGKIEQTNTNIDNLGERINETNLTVIQINEKLDKGYGELKTEIEELRREVEDKAGNLNERMTGIEEQMVDNEVEIRSLNNKVDKSRDQIKNIEENMKKIEKSKGQNVIVRGYNKHDMEVPSMTDYKRVPMEFIQRVKEYLIDIGEEEWVKMKLILDQGFKGVNDHWWGSARDDIKDFNDFVHRFKGRYWSEQVQGKIRNDISCGKYELNRGMTPSAYFLSKVRSARFLEPPIPESLLIEVLSRHFHDCIYSALVGGQIKTIEGLERVLNNFEPQRVQNPAIRSSDRMNDNRRQQGDRQYQERRYIENNNRRKPEFNRNNYGNYRNSGNNFTRGNMDQNVTRRFYNENNTRNNYNNNTNPNFHVNYIARQPYVNQNRRRSLDDVTGPIGTTYQSHGVRMNNYGSRRSRSMERVANTTNMNRRTEVRNEPNEDQREPLNTVVFHNRAENEQRL